MMEHVSENYLKKEIKLGELMYKECVDRLSDFSDIKESLEYLNDSLRELENETRGEMEFCDFNNSLMNLSKQIEELDRFRMFIKLNLNDCKTKIEKGNFIDSELSIEKLKGIQTRTQYFIDSIVAILETLKPLKETVEELSNNFSKKRENDNLMEDIYVRSNECRIRIQQIVSNIIKNTDKGNLHDIMMEDSLLKAGIKVSTVTKKKK